MPTLKERSGTRMQEYAHSKQVAIERVHTLNKWQLKVTLKSTLMVKKTQSFDPVGHLVISVGLDGHR